MKKFVLPLQTLMKMAAMLMVLLLSAAEVRAQTPTPGAVPNDFCGGAFVIPPAGPFPHLTTVTTNITNATTGGDPPLPSCQSSVSRSIWYRFTPAATASYTISSCANAPTGTTVDDTVMAIYTSTGGCAGPFTEIPSAGGSDGCDDDSCTTEANHAFINTTLNAGTQYYVMVWKFATAAPTAGNTAVQLRVSIGGPPPTPTPTPSCAPALNVIQDGTFEAGSPWTAWTTQTSTAFGTPLCDVGCGTGGGTAGGFGGSANWAWFGGTSSAETATAGQSVVIASGGVASLTFQLWIGAVNAPATDVLNVRVDGTIVATFTEPATAEPGYTLRTVNVGAFANGASHAILFEYIGTGGGAVSNFSVDNVSLVAGGACATATPSATASPSVTPTPTLTPPPPTPTPPPPVITSPLDVIGTVGLPFTYQFEATGATSLAVSNLPPGLVFNSTLRAVAGNPTTAGAFPVVLSATNSGGTTNRTLNITVQSLPPSGPIIVSATAATGRTGRAFSFQVQAIRGGQLQAAKPEGEMAPNGAVAIRPLPGCTTNTLPAGDDGSSGAITLPFNINYFGATYMQTFVNNNGNITFTGPLPTYTASDLTTISTPIMAPFWADVDTRGSGSGLVQYGNDTLGGREVFCANWVNVGYYASHDNLLNSFQLLLINRSDTGAGNFDIEYNYNRIVWETGDLSGGTGGFGGNSARAGYANGTLTPGTFFELPGSAVNGGLLDSNMATGLTNNSLNSGGVPGRYIFSSRAGGIDPTEPAGFTVDALPPGLNVDSFTGFISGTPTSDGSFRLLVSASDGTAITQATLQLTFTSNPAVPIITSPSTVILAPGQFFTYSITADATGTFGYIGSDGIVHMAPSPSCAGLPTGLCFDGNRTISGTFNPPFGSDQGSATPPDQTGGIITNNVQIVAANPPNGAGIISLDDLRLPSGAGNIATRLAVGTGENVLIGGFIIEGNEKAPKKVIIRASGPSLTQFGVPNAIADPVLELNKGNVILSSNDNWTDNPGQATQIMATGLQPSNDREAAIVAYLDPGPYTAVVRGKNNSTGNALVEVYDGGTVLIVDTSNSRLANIATRGTVLGGDSVMIGGFIITKTATRMVVRAIGPSLTAFGISGALQDPTLELRDANAMLIANDDWQQGQPAEIQQTGLAPADPRESAVVLTLQPGSYTAIVRGKGGATGVAVVEGYALQ